MPVFEVDFWPPREGVISRGLFLGLPGGATLIECVVDRDDCSGVQVWASYGCTTHSHDRIASARAAESRKPSLEKHAAL